MKKPKILLTFALMLSLGVKGAERSFKKIIEDHTLKNVQENLRAQLQPPQNWWEKNETKILKKLRLPIKTLVVWLTISAIVRYTDAFEELGERLEGPLEWICDLLGKDEARTEFQFAIIVPLTLALAHSFDHFWTKLYEDETQINATPSTPIHKKLASLVEAIKKLIFPKSSSEPVQSNPDLTLHKIKVLMEANNIESELQKSIINASKIYDLRVLHKAFSGDQKP
ncbi:hypothetical protein ACFLY6_00740 [Candidatus Dependentiae bacterium]